MLGGCVRERHKKGGERERPRRPEQSETQRDAVCEGGTASGMRWDACALDMYMLWMRRICTLTPLERVLMWCA